jgi:2-polyprenyl-3-methyl-5-hydroxy-6-metoxy-1,4-benzoquinol methylase
VTPEPSIEYLSPVRDTAFPDNWYELAGSDHFWMHWRLTVALDAMDRLGVPRSRDLQALDIGCGAGLFRGQVEEGTRWNVDGTDLNVAALRMARPGRGRILYYDVTQERDSLVDSYDVCFLFDVIEHVPNERGLLGSALRHVRPGGHLFVNVPAIQAMHSAYDVAAGHLRRYSIRTLTAAFDGLRCEVRLAQYWGFGLLPMLVLRRLVLGLRPTPNTIRAGFRPPGEVRRSET